MFKSKEELGYVDPKINTRGRPITDRSKPKTKRQIKNDEFLSLLRRVKPHMTESINTAVKIMKNEKAADNSRLKAATILLQAYKELVEDVYGGDEPDDENDVPKEVQPANPGVILSMRVVNQDKEDEEE
jgi:hypothetical protein